MAATEALAPRRPAAVGLWTLTTAGAVAAGIVLRMLGIAEDPTAQSFAIVFTAIVVEALPFVLLGAFVAAVLEVYVPERAFAGLGRLPVGLQLPAAALGGFVFPVCECGSVPVARRLIAKGVNPSAGVAFMVAAPIFNPVVLGSTWVAYEARGLGMEMLLGRGTLGLLLALLVGWGVGGDGAGRLLKMRFGIDDPGGGDSCCSPHASKSHAFAAHLTNDFFYMGRFLILGAALAAVIQTVVPQAILGSAVSVPLIAVLALMAVAFVSSLCSEADAFVAVSFTSFPLGSQLAFLVFGPVLDLKLFFLYNATFRRKVVGSIAAAAIPVTVAGALWFEVLVK
ncbi:MAG TPA: permease [Actinomycetota bacterium]|nr:permease [Actinomycetota bacterium]